MTRILAQTAVAAGIAVFAMAQTPQAPTPAPDVVPPPATNAAPTTAHPSADKAATDKAAAKAEGRRGILMDAACAAAQNPGNNSSSTFDASRDTSLSTSSRTTNIGASSAAAANGVNPRQPGQPGANPNSPTTTYGQDRPGTPGVAPVGGAAAGPTVVGSMPSLSGERSRAAEVGATASSDLMLAREKYSSCKITPATKSYALLSDGRIYMVDDAKGVIRQRVTSVSANSDWRTVSIQGAIVGDRISATSMQ